MQPIYFTKFLHFLQEESERMAFGKNIKIFFAQNGGFLSFVRVIVIEDKNSSSKGEDNGKNA
jgi:hypothetical protein